jgi:predicted RNA binding protein YcfA (HicA-like mRNA interferase family)
VLCKKGNPALITVPFHKGKDVNPFLLQRQLKDAGIPLDEFLAAL